MLIKRDLLQWKRSGAHHLIKTLCQCNTVVKVDLSDKSGVGNWWHIFNAPGSDRFAFTCS
jgi:hypothetical protein